MDGKKEDAALVGTLGGAHDGGLPVEQILSHRAYTDFYMSTLAFYISSFSLRIITADSA
jgi:hypothetical protein